MIADPTPGEPVTIVIGERRYDGTVLQPLATGEVRVRTRDTVWTVPASALERRGVVV